MENKEPNRYTKILEAIFIKHFKKGITEIAFERTEFSFTRRLASRNR